MYICDIGPYYCAKGSLNIALTMCMNNMVPGLIDTSLLVEKVHSYAASRKIDSPSNMTDNKVYIYSGTKDTVVRTGEQYVQCDLYIIISHIYSCCQSFREVL